MGAPIWILYFLNRPQWKTQLIKSIYCLGLQFHYKTLYHQIIFLWCSYTQSLTTVHTEHHSLQGEYDGDVSASSLGGIQLSEGLQWAPTFPPSFSLFLSRSLWFVVLKAAFSAHRCMRVFIWWCWALKHWLFAPVLTCSHYRWLC